LVARFGSCAACLAWLTGLTLLSNISFKADGFAAA